MRVPHLALTGLLLALVALAGCRRDDDQAGPPPVAATPDAAVHALAARLQARDLQGFSQLALPPALRAQVAERWNAEQAAKPAPSAEDQAEFAAQMERLTAPGAEDALYAELEPQLAQWEREFAAQAPIAMGMLTGLANVAINRSETLSEAQKRHASGIVGALSGWAMEAPLTDRERARDAVAVTVETARALDLPTADDVMALDFDAALARGGVLLDGAFRVVALYGLDLDASLDGMETEIVAQEDDTALVRVNYTLAGRPLQFDMPMVQHDGLWYSADAIESAERRLAEPLDADAPDTIPTETPDAPEAGSGTVRAAAPAPAKG
ncbi:hypothetical protein [Coralloluteibacterium thermophilus]|uniref:Lipoprotein n=1 Tax=Coralloluteibacterium thermophilum TaxID=2707049 RepID=A0ABV9NK81_9GAMM